MDISVIIVNYNHKYFPKLAVEALEKSNFKGKFEIIIIDNNSTDPESLTFLENAAADKRITLVKNKENIGFGNANNIGGNMAKGKYIFIHNPDVMVKPNSLQLLHDYAEKHKDVGIVAPKLIYSSGVVQESCRRDMSFFDLVLKRTFLGKLPFFSGRVSKYLMQDFDHNKTQEVELVTGAAMFIPRVVWDKVGGFDKRYFLFMEDFDLCKEIRKAGYKIIYYPDCEISHYQKRLSQGPNWKLVFKKVAWLHLSSAIKYFWKWH